MKFLFAAFLVFFASIASTELHALRAIAGLLFLILWELSDR